MTRIAVTGIGAVTALGAGSDATFTALIAGRRAFRAVQGCEVEPREVLAAPVTDELDAPSGTRCDRLSYVAIAEALERAHLVETDLADAALVVGTSAGGMLEAEAVLETIREREPAAADLERLLGYPLSATTTWLAERFGIRRGTTTVCSACASGAVAAVLAVNWLATGRARFVLAGGVDALCRLTLSGFGALGIVAPEACRPFDASRGGLTLGEGAGFLLLETEANARARGAPIRAFLSGWAVAAEAYHLTQPKPDGAPAVAIVRSALRSAGLSPKDVDYVNAHGTGTLHNDRAEACALSVVLGEEAERVWVSSSKGQLGHTLGAAGAVEAVITVCALERGAVPPTGGLAEPLADARLRHVPVRGVEAPLRAALSTSFGFGGTGCALVFEAASGADRRPAAARRERLVITGAAGHGAVPPVFAGDLPFDGETDWTALSTDLLAELDASRSRRFDRATAGVTHRVRAALSGAGLAPEGVALVVGSAFESVERTVQFLARVKKRGVRFAHPAEFPHLVPSAVSGNASIYLGLTGPVTNTADLYLGPESALAVAADFVTLGLCRAAVAASLTVHDPLVDAVLAKLSGLHDERGEGGGALTIETESSAARRLRTPLCRLTYTSPPNAHGDVLREAPPPTDASSALVVVVGDEERAQRRLQRSEWERVSRRSAGGGAYEALTMALYVRAAEALAARRWEQVMLLVAKPRGEACVVLGTAR
ncbi:MAG TPA: beta-ketoacyl-[acyl-carrier-protein] synthase family protein [Polyangiaceae bacterium]|jgi:3-oxoacyl-[acyl-carrier-protein] synthase II